MSFGLRIVSSPPPDATKASARLWRLRSAISRQARLTVADDQTNEEDATEDL
jgi:hypothetical protein